MRWRQRFSFFGCRVELYGTIIIFLLLERFLDLCWECRQDPITHFFMCGLGMAFTHEEDAWHRSFFFSSFFVPFFAGFVGSVCAVDGAI